MKPTNGTFQAFKCICGKVFEVKEDSKEYFMVRDLTLGDSKIIEFPNGEKRICIPCFLNKVNGYQTTTYRDQAPVSRKTCVIPETGPSLFDR